MTKGSETSMKARSLTDDEVTHYWEHGWVKLDALVSASSASKLLRGVRALSGDAEARDAAPQRKASFATAFETVRDPDERDEPLWSFSHSPALATVASRLLTEPGPVRFFRNQALIKPAAETRGFCHRLAPGLSLQPD